MTEKTQGQGQSAQQPTYQAATLSDLRELITQGRRMVSNLQGMGANAQQVLRVLDTIRDLSARLADSGADVRAEAVHREALENTLRGKAPLFLHQLQAAGGLAALRAQANPTREQWWWFLDESVDREQKDRQGRALKTIGIVAAVLVAVALLYRFVLAPNPGATSVMDKKSQAENALRAGDLAGAAAAYRQATEIEPNDPELWAWVGALEEQQGNAAAAAEAYAQAEQLAGSSERFHIVRGTALAGVGRLDEAIADAQAAMAAAPGSPEAQLLLAGIYETQGQNALAMETLQKAAELAEASGNTALVAAIRVRLGMLGQKAPELPTLPATPSS